MVPCQATKGIPVALYQMVTGPVLYSSDVGDPGNGTEFMTEQTPVCCFGYGGTGAFGPGIGIKHFFPHGGEIGQVGGVSKVCLSNLKFNHNGRLLHTAEEGTEGLAGHKIDGAVFDLDHHVVLKLTIKGHKLHIGLLGAIVVVGRSEE